MSLSKAAVSLLTSGVLMASVIPAAGARMVAPTVDAAQSRCATLAGREKTRCLTIHRRNDRLRLQNLEIKSVGRGQTLREQRVITNNTSRSDIRRIGNYDLTRLKMHDRDGGNARRQIKSRSDSARAACGALTGTEKYECIREHWGQLSKGQTR